MIEVIDMAIYDIGGDVLNTAYAMNGGNLQTAYNVSGNSVYSSTPSYSNYTITNLGGAVGQGCDVYDNILAVWTGESAKTLRLYNISTMTLVGQYYGDDVATHGNDITFSNEFYDSADAYPMIYIDGKFCRITNDGLTLVRRIKTSTISDGYNINYGWGIDGNYCYAIGYKDNNYSYKEGNVIMLATLDLSDLTDNGDGTYTPALVSQVTRTWIECIQGASYFDGMLWVVSGFSSVAHVYALDTDTGEILVDINLGESYEAEGLAWAYNANDGWHIIVGQRTIGFRKITFS